MLPLDAISLAAAVVAFVEYGTKLTKTSYEIFRSRSGSTKEHAELRQRTMELANNVRDCGSVQAAAGQSLSLEDTLVQLANECIIISDTLLGKLKSLESNKHGLKRAFDSIQQAVKLSWNAAELGDLRARLDKIQRNVNTCLLSILRQEVAETRQQVVRGVQATQDLHNDQQQHIEDLTRELRALNLASPGTQAQAQPAPNAQEPLSNKLSDLAVTSRLTAILDSLAFEHMHDRYVNIEDATQGTFKWILEDDTTTFKSWLHESDGVFWISGKAGSGKSTLMKYLADHETTKRLLEDWAGSLPLVFGTFYFWNSGSDLQKSQTGLLRSLLFQILKARPECVQSVLPKRQSLRTVDHLHPEPWTRKELFDTLKAILEQLKNSVKFCFFIDGLDEFHGQHFKLADDLDDLLAHRANVKMCVSSRPRNGFEEKYGKNAVYRLRLEQLAENDIRVYVDHTLGENQRFQQLSKQDDRVVTLLQTVVDKAEGVFLWTFFTVRSLADGIAKGDKYDMLKLRLDRIPADLDDYFWQTLDSIDEHYRPYTYRVLLILSELEFKLPESTMLWYLPQYMEDPSGAIHVSRKLVPKMWEAHKHLRQETESNLRLWCGDLVARNPISAPSRINLAHQTIAVFLRSDTVQRQLQATAGQDFQVTHAACSLALMAFAALPVDSAGCYQIVREVIKWAAPCIKAADDPLVELIREMLHVWNRQCDTVYVSNEKRSSAILYPDMPTKPSERTLQKWRPIIYSLAHGEETFIITDLLKENHDTSVSLILALALAEALLEIYDHRRRSSPETVRRLLRLGADPSQRLLFARGAHSTVWEWSVGRAIDELPKVIHERPDIDCLTPVVTTWRALLRHGASAELFSETSQYRRKLANISQMSEDNARIISKFLERIDAMIQQDLI